jgi:TetR/AcrR family transcriptional regulator, transcriptional repressor for nem operon
MYNVKQVVGSGGNTMKVSREQAAENRLRVLETAARLFREKGFDGIGVADLMNTAGLTHGGFYGQFSSKEDLAAQACARALADSEKKWERLTADKGKDPLKTFAESYLSARHRDDAGNGCAFVALGAEAPRWGRAVQRVFTEGLLARVARLIKLVPGQSEKARRARAIATMASLVGGVVLARAVDDPKLSDEILQAVKSEL